MVREETTIALEVEGIAFEIKVATVFPNNELVVAPAEIEAVLSAFEDDETSEFAVALPSPLALRMVWCGVIAAAVVLTNPRATATLFSSAILLANFLAACKR